MDKTGKSIKIAEYDKFNMYFLDEVKKMGNDIISPIEEENTIIFTSGNTYQYDLTTKTIYLIKTNEQIAIANDIEDCTFEEIPQEEKTIIKVTMKLDGKDKITEYVLGYGNEYNNYQNEADYIVPVTGVSLNKSETSLTYLYGSVTEALTATITPLDANNKNLIWSSSNNNIATVDSTRINYHGISRNGYYNSYNRRPAIIHQIV